MYSISFLHIILHKLYCVLFIFYLTLYTYNSLISLFMEIFNIVNYILGTRCKDVKVPNVSHHSFVGSETKVVSWLREYENLHTHLYNNSVSISHIIQEGFGLEILDAECVCMYLLYTFPFTFLCTVVFLFVDQFLT